MDRRLIGQFTKDRLCDSSIYWLALIVGTVINCYGHLLVPWMRSGKDPFALLAHELEIQPGLTIFTILVTYCFPFGVALYSSVAARYKNRRLESISDFPDRRQDPVFRADRSGVFLEVGAVTQKFFASHHISRAQDITGAEIWQEILSDETSQERFCKTLADGEEYQIAHAHTAHGNINVYLTRISNLTRC